MPSDAAAEETYNPWTVLNVVFHHLADQGLHPTLGEAGNPGDVAATLLRALAISPTFEGDRRMAEDVRARLAQLRDAMFEQRQPDRVTPRAVSN